MFLIDVIMEGERFMGEGCTGMGRLYLRWTWRSTRGVYYIKGKDCSEAGGVLRGFGG